MRRVLDLVRDATENEFTGTVIMRVRYQDGVKPYKRRA